MTDDRPSPQDVESYLEEIERNGWSVEDYSANYGPDNPTSVTVELEWSPGRDIETSADQRALTTSVKDAIENLDDAENGAPRDEVVSRVVDELDLNTTVVREEVRTLKEHGELYAPADGYLRVI